MRSLARVLIVAAGGLCLAGSASAISTTYSMVAGSRMSMTNQICTPCIVPVTGSVTLDDNGAGGVSLTSVNLAHDPYQVALPAFVSVILDRDSITLASGSVAGTGSTLTSVLFGATSLANVGTISCVSGIVTCASLLGIPGLPDGTYPLPSPVAVNLGTWTFDGLGGLSASFVYTALSGANPSTETLFLFGSTTPVPEPATGLLVAAGSIALAQRRRLSRRSAT
jgi:hypothetical protein